MAIFQPIKDTKANVLALPIIDGQILLTTDQGVNNELYLDTGSTRELFLKGISVDSALSTTSTNAIANNALTNSIVNTLAEVASITDSNIPCGTLAVKELNTNLNAEIQTLSNVGIPTLLANSTVASWTEKTIVDIDNFREVLLLLKSTSRGAILKTHILPVSLFKTLTASTTASLFAIYEANPGLSVQAYYSNDTTIYLYASTGYEALFYGVK